jgi:hypothetical protein
MKRTLLLSSAAVALTLGLMPALAQDSTDSKMKREPAATEQHDRNANRHAQKATEHNTKRNAENKDRSGARSATGQANSENADKAKAAETDADKSGADKAKSTDNEKSSAQPKRAEDQNRKGAGNASTGKANSAEPSENAEQNNTRSPAAQKSTQSNEPNRNAQTSEPNRAAKSNDTKRNAQTNEPTRNSAETKNGAEPRTRVSASLDPQKKSRLTTAFDRVNVRPVTRVNFAVSVGTLVPRDIEVRPVPSTVVEIVPQYRGYDFFLVRDEVVIVEPRTHKIVDVIERGPSRSRAEATTVHKPSLSAQQREIIRRHATTRRTVTTGSAPRSTTEVTVGETLPDTVEIESFPEDVYRDVPAVREYRYIERGDDVYLVDPSSRRVIEEVR